MSNDSYTETTSQSWFQRLGGSIKGVFFGVLLFFGAFPLLFINEGRAVKTAKSLEEGAAAVVAINADNLSASTEGKLIHLTGAAKTSGALDDPQFGISAQAIKLRRKVEMYQWKQTSKSEEKKKLGGGTETVTTYDYEKDWSSSVIKSSDFKQPAGHQNPAAKPFQDLDKTAQQVSVGAYDLSSGLISQISNFTPVSLNDGHLARLSEDVKRRARLQGGLIYIGTDPTNPQVGDARISFEQVESGPVSVVAKQQGKLLGAYQTSAGRTIEMLRTGSHTAESMFQAAMSANATMTWALRFAGFFMMFIGISMIFKPFAVMGDIVPFIGSLISGGISLFAFVVAAPVSLAVIAVGWIFYRPLIGILLLACGIGVIALGSWLILSRRRASQAAVASSAV